MTLIWRPHRGNGDWQWEGVAHRAFTPEVKVWRVYPGGLLRWRYPAEGRMRWAASFRRYDRLLDYERLRYEYLSLRSAKEAVEREWKRADVIARLGG